MLGAEAFQKIPARRAAAPAFSITLTQAERAELQRWTRSRTSAYRLVVRSRIVLLASGGVPPAGIASEVKVTPATARVWLKRFEEGGLAALTTERAGRGRPPGMSRRTVVSVLRAMGSVGAPVTVRRVAGLAGVGATTVWRAWQRYGLGPDSPLEVVETVLAQLT